MKRLLLRTLAVLMTTVFIGCSDKTPDPIPEPPKPDKEAELVLSVDKASFKEGEAVKFTVSTEVALKEDVVIGVSSSDTKVATVPETVTLKAGSLLVDSNITGVAGGSATIIISTTDGTKIKTGAQVVTVVGKGDVILNMSVEKKQIYAQELVKFTISTEVAPDKDIVINLSSSRPSIATATATVTLKANETSVTGDIVGVAAGESTITMLVNNVAVGTDNIIITVSEKPSLILSINAATNVVIGSTIKVTVTTPGPATEKLTITLVNDKPTVTELGTNTLTIEQGAASAETTLKGLIAGESNISFTVSPSVAIDKNTIKVFSGNARTDIIPFIVPVSIQIPEGEGGNNWKFVYHTEDNYALGLWTTTATWLETQVGKTHKITIENYGKDWVGEMRNGYGVFTPVAAGTLINKDLAWMKGTDAPRTRPAVWTQDGFNIGENIYVVLYCGYGPGKAYQRGWMKITTTVDGELTVLDGALCMTDDENVEFRVGEK